MHYHLTILFVQGKYIDITNNAAIGDPIEAPIVVALVSNNGPIYGAMYDIPIDAAPNSKPMIKDIALLYVIDE